MFVLFILKLLREFIIYINFILRYFIFCHILVVSRYSMNYVSLSINQSSVYFFLCWLNKKYLNSIFWVNVAINVNNKTWLTYTRIAVRTMPRIASSFRWFFNWWIKTGEVVAFFTFITPEVRKMVNSYIQHIFKK